MQWPNLIQSLFDGMASPAKVTEALFSIDCLLKESNVNEDRQVLYVKMIVIGLMPFIQGFLSLAFYTCSYLCCKM